MSYDQLDRDVARYVLAYLAREGYSHTMSAFLQECSCLPASTATMVLPETSLSTIIAEHKTRKESGKLGPRASWDALWEKLQHYLTQLRTLSSTLLESHHDQPYKNKSTGRRREYRTKTRQRPSTVPSPSPLVHTTPSNVPICHTQVAGPSSSAVISAPEPTPSSSPRKKREPSRLQPHSDTLVALSSTSSSSSSSTAVGVPAPQQLLDILLEDESLQHQLAHLINSSLVSEGGAELTDDALDNILAMTSQDMLPVTTVLSGGTEDNNSSLNDDGGPQLKKHCSSRPDMELVSSSDNQQRPKCNLSTSFKDS